MYPHVRGLLPTPLFVSRLGWLHPILVATASRVTANAARRRLDPQTMYHYFSSVIIAGLLFRNPQVCPAHERYFIPPQAAGAWAFGPRSSCSKHPSISGVETPSPPLDLRLDSSQHQSRSGQEVTLPALDRLFHGLVSPFFDITGRFGGRGKSIYTKEG